MPGGLLSTPPQFAKQSSLFLIPVFNHTQITICRALRYRPPAIRETVLTFLLLSWITCKLQHARRASIDPSPFAKLASLFSICFESYANYNMPGGPVSTPRPSAKLSSLCWHLSWVICKLQYAKQAGIDFPSIRQTVVICFAFVLHFSASLHFASDALQTESTPRYQQWLRVILLSP